MAAALKKHLAKLEVKPGDLVLFKPPLGAQPTGPNGWRAFVIAVAEELASQMLGPVVVVQPGFDWETLTNKQLNEMGMMRLWPPGQHGIPIDALQEEALAAVRIAFASARERAEARIARQAEAVPDPSDEFNADLFPSDMPEEAMQTDGPRIQMFTSAEDDEEPRPYDPLLDFDYSAPDPPPGTSENP